MPRPSLRRVGHGLAGLLLVGGLAQPAWGQFGGYGTGLPPGGQGFRNPAQERDREDGEPGVRVVMSMSGQLIFTNNVDLAPSAERESDVVLLLRPALRFDYRAARASARGIVAAPIRLYAKTGSDNNEVRPFVDLLGRLEVVEDFFFVEAAANVKQVYYDPFGAQPIDFSSATDNELTTQVYRVSPQINGRIGSDTAYFLRNDNIWSNSNYSGSDDRRDYFNRLVGTIERAARPFGWGLDVSRSQYEFGDQPDSQIFQLARARATWQPDSRFRAYVSGGYEDNRLTLSDTDGAIYGLGFAWRPDPRTSLSAGWEERFFGGSWYLHFNHRAPRSVWSLSGTRNITTYADEVARLPQGSSVPGLLNDLFAGRIPDPAQREKYIEEFIEARGLPLVIGDPIALYAQQVYLQEHLLASVGLIGARNNLFFSAFYRRSEPLVGEDPNLIDPAQIDNTQRGGNVVWTHRLTSTTTLTASGSYIKTTANPDERPEETDQWRFRLTVSHPLSPWTRVFAGARYQTLDSNVRSDYSEAAVFAGVNHIFH